MWTVYFETSGYAEVAARFTREEEYVAVASALEAQARAAGFLYVTESYHEGDLTTFNIDLSTVDLGRALIALGMAFPLSPRAYRVEGSTLIVHLGCAATAQDIERLHVILPMPRVAYTVNGRADTAQPNTYDPATFIEE